MPPTASFQPITGGGGIRLFTNGPRRDLAAAGFVEEEFSAAGTATSYRLIGELRRDGRWTAAPDVEAAFRTRILVRRPQDPARFNGTVVVEWCNISSGLEVPADYAYVGDELLRGGYAHVAVSAQALAIEGGDAAIPIELIGSPAGLRAEDPDRYGELFHPGDAYSYDIFSQIGRALAAPGGSGALGDLVPERVLASGESQSAFRLTTYVNAVHQLASVFDGFLIHSRGRSAASLGDTGPIAEAIIGDPVEVRDDCASRVLIVEAEGDLVGRLDYRSARQPDSTYIRLWEMTGTAHADRYSAGDIGSLLGCAAPINDGPAHYLLKSALRHLDAWARGNGPPPAAPRIEFAGDGSIRRDEHGNALGGIRTPVVDVPVATHSGEPVGDVLICAFFGSSTPFEPERLVELYGTESAYVSAFDAALDDAVAGGWVLPEDRAELAAEARSVRFG